MTPDPVSVQPAPEVSAALDVLPSLAWTADAAGNLTFVNRAGRDYGEAFGAVLAGQPLLDWLHPDDRDATARLLRHEAERAEAFTAEFRLRSAEGTYRWFAVQTAPQRDAQGRLLGWIGSGVDVHDHRVAAVPTAGDEPDGPERDRTTRPARAASRQDEAFLRGVLDGSPDCVKVLSLDGTLLSMNEGGQRLMEIDDFGSCAGAFWPDFWPDRQDDVNDALSAARDGRVGRFGGPSPTMKGTPKWWDVLVSPLHGVDGEITHLLSVSRDVTELHHAVHAAAEREQRLRLVLAASRLGSWEIDVRTHTVHPSPEVARLLGMPDRTGTLREFEDLIHPDDRAAVKTAYEEAVAGGADDVTLAHRLLHPERGVIWVEQYARVLRNARGQATRVVGLSGDVTERRQALDALRESELRFRLLAEGSGDLISRHAPDGTYLYASPSFERVLGYRTSELVGRPAADFLHPEDLPLTLDRQAQLLSVGAPYTVTCRLRRKDGEFVWVETTGAAVHDAHGEVLEIQCATRDVTGRVEARRELTRHNLHLERQVRERTAELTRERRFLSALLESLGDGIVACDADGNLTLFNDATRAFHGLPAEPLPPEAWSEYYSLYHADGVTPLQKEEIPLFRAFSGEQVRGAEMVIRPRTGQARFVLADGSPILSPDGQKLGAVVAMHDITDRQQAEAALRRANQELHRSNSELERFAYITSHDLQEPLRTVASFTGLVQTRYGDRLDAQGQQFLEIIARGALRMKTLVDDILTFSRLGGEQMEFAAVDSRVPLDEALARLQARIAESGAVVTHDPMPTVWGDGPQLAQVFQNLIGNALKFRDPHVPPRVHVGVSAERDVWHVRVSDNGVGIERQYLDRIFEMFQRLHTRERYEGSGLGLSIAQKIVTRHGGRLWADSDGEQGATFHFTLPRSPVGR